MNKAEQSVVLCIIMLFAVLFSCLEASAYPRDVKWKQVKTEHFRIMYSERQRNVVQHVAGMVESIHQEMSRFFEFTDTIKTDVVLTDHIDTFDRFNLEVVRKLPGKLIVLHLGDRTAGAPSFDLPAKEWLVIQFIYQYSSIMRHEMDSRFRSILSNVYPDLGFSGWMDGGMALYMMAYLQGSSGRSPYLDMLIRTDILEATLEDLKERAATGYQTWPGDIGLFLYGYSFLRYLSDSYGVELVAKLNQTLGDTVPQPFEKDVFTTVYGKDFETLQQEWLSNTYAFYQTQIQEIQQRPLSHSQPLSDSGYFTGFPVFSPDGQYLYYIEDTPHDTRALVQLRLEDRKKIRLKEGNFSGSFSISSDGQRIYFCKADLYKAYYQRSDLYMLDLATRKVKRLTRGARAFDPAISPDESVLVYVTTSLGDMKLMQMNLESGETSTLFAASERRQVRQPAFSADGARIAVQFLGVDGRQDIYVMNRDGTEAIPILVDYAVDASPSWGLNDEHLFFNSDRSGVPNIFAYSFSEQRLYQVTNVLTGAFDPTTSRDGSLLAFTEYSSKGMDVHLIELAPQQWFAAPPVSQLSSPMVPERFIPIETGSETRYKALPTLWPAIFPLWGRDEDGLQLGLNFSGEDILDRDAYSLSLLYGIESTRLEVELQYVNNRFYPLLALTAYDRSDVYANLFRDVHGNKEDYWERQQGGGIEVGIPLYRTLRTDLYMTIQYDYQEISSLIHLEELSPPFPDEGSLGGVSGRFILKSFERPRFSISPEAGILTSGRYRRYDEIFGSDYNIDEVVGDLDLFVPLPLRHHVLFLRGAGGLSDGDTLQQGMFQLGGFLVDFETELIYEPKFFLRGYPRNAFSGDHFVLGTAEYRFPIWYIQDSTLNGLLFWNSIAGGLFVDAGYAWEDVRQDVDMKYSVGGEFTLNIGYRYGRLPLGINVGVAHGFDEYEGTTQVYFRFYLNR